MSSSTRAAIVSLARAIEGPRGGRRRGRRATAGRARERGRGSTPRAVDERDGAGRVDRASESSSESSETSSESFVEAVTTDARDEEGERLVCFLRRACATAGKDGNRAEDVAARLREQWFETVEDVLEMTVEDARAVGMPMRLWRACAETAAAEAAEARGEDDDDDDDDDDEGRRETHAGAVTSDEGAEEESSAWIGGELPGEGERVPALERPSGFQTTPLADVRVTQRKRLKPFSLRGEEVTKSLQDELDGLVRDLTSRRVRGGRAPVRERTASNHVAVAKQFMGWLARESEHAMEFATPTDDGVVVLKPGVSLRDVFPSRESSGAQYAIEYVQWLVDVRGIKSTTEDFQLRSLVALAKWVHDHADDDGIAPPCVQELIRVQRSARDRAKNAPHAADDDRKWLEWDQYLALVEHLKLECAPLEASGKERSARDVAMSVQRYLLFAILACIPDRQRTLRELQLNKTLFRDASSGTWMVRHGPDDYKTGGAYGERPALVIDPRVYPALESWLNVHRSTLSPTHDFVFTRPNGAPWSVSELSRTFSRTALRCTGQKTNPHLIRDMIVTHVRSQGIASDAELEALARFMGHSSAMQKSTYDRRTQQERVNPALSLMANVNAAKRRQSS